jgi:HEAT repeat protein
MSVRASSRTVAALLWMALAPAVLPQPSEPIAALLLRFDNEHDLAAKEQLLLKLTKQGKGAAPALLRLAQSTRNTDTRWMAMRGMATLGCTACAPFLEASLKDSNPSVRANAARALGDLRIRNASGPLLAMFDVEREPAAIEQASLAIGMLDVKAAEPYIREKIPKFTGQTRNWLIQALGMVGSSADVPIIAEYLDDRASDIAAAQAIEALTGVSFGPPPQGLFSDPPPITLAARAWWKSHKDQWPHCEDCHPK